MNEYTEFDVMRGDTFCGTFTTQKEAIRDAQERADARNQEIEIYRDGEHYRTIYPSAFYFRLQACRRYWAWHHSQAGYRAVLTRR